MYFTSLKLDVFTVSSRGIGRYVTYSRTGRPDGTTLSHLDHSRGGSDRRIRHQGGILFTCVASAVIRASIACPRTSVAGIRIKPQSVRLIVNLQPGTQSTPVPGEC